MKIAYGSDFHLEFYGTDQTRSIIDKWNFHPDTHLIVIAGDLHVGAKRVIETLEYINKVHNMHTLYVPGNHEYYNSSFEKENRIFMENGLEHIGYTVLLRNSCVFEDVSFCGCMGNIDGSWESINRGIHGALNDFHVIIDFSDHEEYGKLDYNQLERDLIRSNGYKSLVITHTMPSPKCVAPKYQGSYLNPCFANNWEDLIFLYKPIFWICGHTHEIGNVCVDETSVLMNPMGYPKENKVWKWRYVDV